VFRFVCGLIKRSFLPKDERAKLTSIARKGLEKHRAARRADTILLLDKGKSYEKVSDAFLPHDGTTRSWCKIYRNGGSEALEMFDFTGGHRTLNAEDTRSGMIKLIAGVVLPLSRAACGRH